MLNNNQRKILSEAIEEAISSFGDSPKQAIFFHLETSFALSKNKIPGNLPKFRKALEEIFGPGTCYLEKLIAKHLYEKLGLEFKELENWDLLEYVSKVEINLPSPPKSKEVKRYE